ncbi:hypothetical protein [Gordonibacter massiliensis (ex Traore et al. 2017)]|uniref:hypothetical protein n=1 Tax=Gordonibacter massiliensis (ex Traore et al. 2017) TaxID=1841863 RepID=UPI0009AFD56E|nr:hypothetical protein [Gordonibacter massiliensis (ex Traore et al. 2017)]MBX9032470.1 hypothetical protein [Gordonibacter massiliensis (ex Traore et al. 2017)]
MVVEGVLADCFPCEGVEFDGDELEQASGGISYPNQVVFYCAKCEEAKTVLRSGLVLVCPDCGTPFGTAPSPVNRP